MRGFNIPGHRIAILAPRRPLMYDDITPTFLEDSEEPIPRTLAAASGLMDRNHRRGPFGGGSRIGLMMDDQGDQSRRYPHWVRGFTTRVFGRIRVDARNQHARRRMSDFSRD
jgi:hypothetical protein